MEVDPVVLQLRAELNGYLTALRNGTRTVDQELGAQEKRAQRLEQEMRKSSEAIKGHIKGLAAGLAAAFTGRELVGLLDSFTRLQNNLRVAGVAGDEMKAVQDRLFASAQKYGVELEGLSSLFSTLTQASTQLGASQSDVFKVSDAVSASLKITGLSAGEASGALQQLGQALRGGTIQAEEYNSLLDGLYPLLEAAANGSSRFGGSVAELTKQVKSGKVSSQEFFRAIIAGSDVLDKKAANAALTLSAGVTSLTNAMTVYFGEADKANGVSAALGETLGLLADHLDTIIPALATIATYMGVNMVTGAVSASAATGVLGNTMFALQARAAGAATSMEALAFAMNGLKLNIVAVGLTALVAGIAYLATRNNEAASATDTLAASTNAASKFQADMNAILDRDPSTKVAGDTNKLAAARRDAAKAAYTQATAEIALRKAQAQDDLNRAQRGVYVGGNRGTGVREVAYGAGRGGAMDRAKAEKDAKDRLAAANAELNAVGGAYNAAIATPSAGMSGAASVPKSVKAKGKGASGPTSAEIAQRFNDELASLMAQSNSAQQSIAKSTGERAEMELRNVELSRIRALDGIESDKNYSRLQKDRLKAQVETLAAAERERIAAEKKAQDEQDARDLAQERYANEQAALQVQYDLADSQSERKRIALELVALETRHQKALLEAVLASETAGQAEKDRARVQIDGINAQASARSDSASRANESPLEAYKRKLNKSDGAISEDIEGYVVDELNSVRDGIRGAMEKAIGVKDPLLSGILNTFIEQVILKPMAEALASTSGGSGGGIGGFLASVGTSLFGRASGGYVAPGQMVRVNESATPGRVEGFQPTGSGHVIPLGRMNAGQGRSGARVFNVSVDARNSVTPDGFAQQLSGQILQQAAAMDMQTGSAVLRAVPGRFDQYNRDGS